MVYHRVKIETMCPRHYFPLKSSKRVLTSTARGRQQRDPKALGLRPRGGKGAFYFALEDQPDGFLILKPGSNKEYYLKIFSEKQQEPFALR